jgi:hypothetical protein
MHCADSKQNGKAERDLEYKSLKEETLHAGNMCGRVLRALAVLQAWNLPPTGKWAAMVKKKIARKRMQ